MNIYEVADKCGVSIATVSRVLNNSPKVSDRTREHVLSVMKQSGYSPNAFARGLGLGTMQLVSVLCTDVRDTFYSEAVALVEEELRKRGLDIILCCTGTEPEEKKKRIREMVRKKVDAMILIGSIFREEDDNAHIAAAAAQVPVILINGVIDLPNVYSICCDEFNAAVNAVGHLAERGYRRILYLYDRPTYSGCQKLKGYRSGMERRGLDSQELCHMVPRDLMQVRGYVASLLEQGLDFDAVLTSEDLLAIGALQELRGQRLDYPVIGFNNSMLCQCSTPALSSIDNQLRSLCHTAIDVLDRLREKESPANKTIFNAQLVIRASSQPASDQTVKKSSP